MMDKMVFHVVVTMTSKMPVHAKENRHQFAAEQDICRTFCFAESL